MCFGFKGALAAHAAFSEQEGAGNFSSTLSIPPTTHVALPSFIRY